MHFCSLQDAFRDTNIANYNVDNQIPTTNSSNRSTQNIENFTNDIDNYNAEFDTDNYGNLDQIDNNSNPCETFRNHIDYCTDCQLYYLNHNNTCDNRPYNLNNIIILLLFVLLFWITFNKKA